MQRLRSAVLAALFSALTLSSFGAIPAQAANTRVVYFGSAPCPGGAASCPGSSSWAFAYPSGTGGGYDAATGQPIAGQASFSPVATGGSTATDIVVANASGSTLTQIQLNGGTTSPNPINSTSVPKMPSPPTPTDPAFFHADGTQALPSLPQGMDYQAVYVVRNPGAIGVSCSLTASTQLAVGLFDGLSCALGNMSAGASLTLRVVVAVTAPVAAGTYEPWFELGVKEGSSGTGSNSDAFFAYSRLTVDPASCAAATSYFLDSQNVRLSNQSGVGTPCAQATGLASGSTIGGIGTLASVAIRNPAQSCPKSVSCFGQDSVASVLAGGVVPGGLQWTITWSPLPISGKPKGVIHELANYDPTNPSTYVLISFTGKQKCSTTLTTNCWTFAGQITGGYQAVFITPFNGTARGW
jgi:hypothetical protein